MDSVPIIHGVGAHGVSDSGAKHMPIMSQIITRAIEDRLSTSA